LGSCPSAEGTNVFCEDRTGNAKEVFMVRFFIRQSFSSSEEISPSTVLQPEL
jgi:hypothetical protein